MYWILGTIRIGAQGVNPFSAKCLTSLCHHVGYKLYEGEMVVLWNMLLEENNDVTGVVPPLLACLRWWKVSTARRGRLGDFFASVEVSWIGCEKSEKICQSITCKSVDVQHERWAVLSCISHRPTPHVKLLFALHCCPISIIVLSSKL